MSSFFNINRVLEGYEIRTIDPDDGELKSINDIFASGGGGSADLSNYLRLNGAPFENIVSEVSVSGNTSIEGALTSKQGVIIPSGGVLSTDNILNLSGSDIGIRTTGSNGAVFYANDVEKVRMMT